MATSPWEFICLQRPLLKQPLYSPIMLRVTFFPSLKVSSRESLRGSSRRPFLKTWETIKMAIMTELRSIPKKSFQLCIEAWLRSMENMEGWEGWKDALDLTGIYLKRKPCSLLFGIEINCLSYICLSIYLGLFISIYLQWSLRIDLF